MAVNFSDVSPAPPLGAVNVKWQQSGADASAYVDAESVVPTSPNDPTEFLNGDTTPTFAQVKDTDLATTDVTGNNVSSTKHGFAPKSPADSTKFLNGAATPAYAQVKDSDLSTSDITTNDVSSTKHGLAPKSPADPTQFLNGAATPAYAQVQDSDLAASDITTNNASSTKHGFAPKSPADATQFLNGAATPAYAAVKDSDLATTDITTNNVSITKHGFAPKAPNDATKFLDGTGAYSTPAGTTVSPVEAEVVSFSGTSGTLAHTPSVTSGYTKVKLYRNGIRQLEGGGNDFTRSGATITLATAAGGSDVFVADYWQ